MAARIHRLIDRADKTNSILSAVGGGSQIGRIHPTRPKFQRYTEPIKTAHVTQATVVLREDPFRQDFWKKDDFMERRLTDHEKMQKSVFVAQRIDMKPHRIEHLNVSNKYELHQ